MTDVVKPLHNVEHKDVKIKNGFNTDLVKDQHYEEALLRPSSYCSNGILIIYNSAARLAVLIVKRK